MDVLLQDLRYAGRMPGFALLLSAEARLALRLAPALRASRPGLAGALEGARAGMLGSGHRRRRGWAMAGEAWPGERPVGTQTVSG